MFERNMAWMNARDDKLACNRRLAVAREAPATMRATPHEEFNTDGTCAEFHYMDSTLAFRSSAAALAPGADELSKHRAYKRDACVDAAGLVSDLPEWAVPRAA